MTKQTHDPEGALLRDFRKKGYFTIDNELFSEGYAALLGPYGIAVYNCLCLHVNSLTGAAFPSYQTVADETGMSRRKAMQTIACLVDFRLISVIPGEQGHPNTCYLLDKSEWEKPQVVNDMHQCTTCTSAPHAPGSAPHAPEVVHHVHPNNKNKQDERTTHTPEPHDDPCVCAVAQKNQPAPLPTPRASPLEEDPLVRLLSRCCQVTPWKFTLLLQQHATTLRELCHAVTYGTQQGTIKNIYTWLSYGTQLFHNGQFAFTNGQADLDIPALFTWFQALPTEKRNQAIMHLKQTLPLEVRGLDFSAWWTHPDFQRKVHDMYLYDTGGTP